MASLRGTLRRAGARQPGATVRCATLERGAARRQDTAGACRAGFGRCNPVLPLPPVARSAGGLRRVRGDALAQGAAAYSAARYLARRPRRATATRRFLLSPAESPARFQHPTRYDPGSGAVPHGRAAAYGPLDAAAGGAPRPARRGRLAGQPRRRETDLGSRALDPTYGAGAACAAARCPARIASEGARARAVAQRPVRRADHRSECRSRSRTGRLSGHRGRGSGSRSRHQLRYLGCAPGWSPRSPRVDGSCRLTRVALGTRAQRQSLVSDHAAVPANDRRRLEYSRGHDRGSASRAQLRRLTRTLRCLSATSQRELIAPCSMCTPSPTANCTLGLASAWTQTCRLSSVKIHSPAGARRSPEILPLSTSSLACCTTTGSRLRSMSAVIPKRSASICGSVLTMASKQASRCAGVLSLAHRRKASSSFSATASAGRQLAARNSVRLRHTEPIIASPAPGRPRRNSGRCRE